jgi:peptidyl-prolyl cis-trans isomerase C
MKTKPLNRLMKAALLMACSTLVTIASAQNIAIVNGVAIPKAKLEAIVSLQAIKAKAAGQQLPPNFADTIKPQLIDLEIYTQEATKRGLAATDEFKLQIELAKQSALANALFEDFKNKSPVTEADIKAEYDKFAKENSGKEYKVRHILVEKEDTAKAIIASLKKGGKFEVIAKKESKDPGSGANGGDLDWAGAASYVKEFSDAMLKLEKGKMTDTPVKTQFGYHIIRLDDVREAQLPPFDQVKPQIKQQLEQQKMAKFQDELRKSAKIE